MGMSDMTMDWLRACGGEAMRKKGWKFQIVETRCQNYVRKSKTRRKECKISAAPYLYF